MATTMNPSTGQGPMRKGMGQWSGMIYFLVALAIVIGAGMLFMRGRSTTEPTTPDSPTMDGRRNDQGQGGENMQQNRDMNTQPGTGTNPGGQTQ